MIPRSARILVVALVGVVALLGLWGLSTGASNSAVSEPPGAVPSMLALPAGSGQELQPAAISGALDPGFETEVQPSTTLTHTVFLSSILRDHWQAPDSLLGVQLYWDYKDQEVVRKAAQMGARWARVPLSWLAIERENTTPDNYAWPGHFGDWLARLSAANIQVILTLGGNPSWAATYSGGPIDRTDMAEFVQFMAAAVAHYSAPPYNVKHWEFYNEPDNGRELRALKGWGYFGNDPAAYVEMLAAVYQPMKKADPEAQIVFGGLAYDWWTSEGGPFVEEFLDGVLANGGAEFFDVMNFHYYPAFHVKWDPHGKGIIGKATYLRDKLAAYGVDKPLICTEASMWSDPEHGGSDELQSRYVPQLYAQSMAADLQITVWLKLVDNDAPGRYKYGLVNPADFGPKPAYFAYQTLARQLAAAHYVRTLSTAEIGSDQIEAYEFLAPGRSTRIIVAWTDDNQEHQLQLPTQQAVVVDKFGSQTTIGDRDDGISDGRVGVFIGPSPVYLRFSP